MSPSLIPASGKVIARRWLLPVFGVPLALVLATTAPSEARRGSKPAPEPATDSQPNLLGKYGDWEAYSGMTGGRKVCFALGRPSSSQTNPANRPRDPTYVFISTRPADNVRNEVSIIIGYSFKPNTDANVDIGGTKFAMMTQNDGAWLKNATDETRMLSAMRDGSELVVKGASVRGTQTTDKYSLKGLGPALDRVARECR
ncbi:MAG: hypothetical protein QOD74_439 [Variibacter sp.]|jgi:invasion protein IalB|nr:hypothetical protein [Variibacter sp.]